MSSWFHTIGGQYSPRGKWVGLDYAKLLRDKRIGDSIMAHEMAHAAMSQETDFGQASHVILNLNEDFNHLSDSGQKEIGSILFSAQDFVQEGLATLFQIARLGSLTNKRFALEWARDNLHEDYLDKLQKLEFVLSFSTRYRDYFTQKISYLALETGIRKDIAELNLLADPTVLKKYLGEDDKNPNRRLEKLIDILKYKKWIVTKPIPEIAKLCGIKHFKPTTKKEIAEFMNYATNLTSNPRNYSESDIGDTSQGAETFIQTGKNMIIGNMNINFQDGEALFNLNDFLHYSDLMELVFVNPAGKLKNADAIKKISGYEPEVNIAGVLKTGEKYLTVVSKEKGAEVLNNELKTASIFVKWGGYDVYKDQMIWSVTARPPNLVVYNNAEQMKVVFEGLVRDKPEVKLSHLHMGATEGHPVQSLIVKVDGQLPIHFVNAWGNKTIVEVLSIIRGQSRVITNNELIKMKQHLNNLFGFWLNMGWDVDWVETMLDGSILIFRKNDSD